MRHNDDKEDDYDILAWERYFEESKHESSDIGRPNP